MIPRVPDIELPHDYDYSNPDPLKLKEAVRKFVIDCRIIKLEGDWNNLNKEKQQVIDNGISGEYLKLLTSNYNAKMEKILKEIVNIEEKI